MSQVQATMGITKDAMSTVDGQSVNTMDTLSDLAKKMGSETAFSASECAQALNYLALAGYDTQQMCDTLPTVLNLAAAGDIDLAEASDMVTDAMSALGMGVDQAGTMVDQMAKTASTTNTSVAQLGEGILTIGATAKSMAGGTAELNTALGILANNGIKGAEGGTHLRNVILSLQEGCEDGAVSVGNVSVAVYDAQGNMRSLNDILGDLNTQMDGMSQAEKNDIISQIFNKTDLASVNALLANTGDTWNDLQQSITDSSGAAQQMADTQLDNLSGQLTILKSALEGLAISIGELLLPYIKNIVSGIQSFVDWLNSLDEGVKKVIVTVALIAAAVGPVLIVVGKVMSSVGTIMTTIPKLVSMVKTVGSGLSSLFSIMSANPIVLIIAAIAALVAAFIYLWNTNEDFRNFWINLWETIKSTCESVVTAISTFFTETWTAITTTTTEVWTAISTFFTTIWTTISTTFTTVVTTIKNFIVNAFNSIKTTITTIFNTVYTFITTIFTNIYTAVSSKITAVKTTIVNGLNAAANFVKGLASQAYSWGADIINGIVNGIKSCIGKVTSAVSNVASTIKSYLHFSVPDEGPLKDYESWMPDFMSGLAKGITDSKDLVEKAMSNVADSMDLASSIPDLEASVNANVKGSDDNNQAVTLNQPILLDGKTITTLVSQIQYSQGQARLRNLGTS